MNRIPCIGVTGGIACGKSTFAGFLREFGCEIFDTDDATHELEAPGGKAIEPLVRRFGVRVLDSGGGIDRKALGAVVFGDAEAMAALNAIVHPLVRDALAEWRSRPLPDGCSVKAALVPLLFEVGWCGSDWDAIVCVACSGPEQQRRLMGRGLTAEEARARVASQWPVEKKAELSDIVIWNDGDLDSLRAEAQKTVAGLLEKLNERILR